MNLTFSELIVNSSKITHSNLYFFWVVDPMMHINRTDCPSSASQHDFMVLWYTYSVCAATLVKGVRGSMLCRNTFLQFRDSIICSRGILEIRKLRFSHHTYLTKSENLVFSCNFFLIFINWLFFKNWLNLSRGKRSIILREALTFAAVLFNTVATSHTWLFKLKIKILKIR